MNRPRTNEEIAAGKAAAERRRRRADEMMRLAIDVPAELEAKERTERLAQIRRVDRSAADSLEQLERWREIVRKIEDGKADKAELARARRTRDWYHARWVVLAATHPRLRQFVKTTELEAFKAELGSELARAREDYLRADERLRELRARRKRGERVTDAELYEADATKEVLSARYDLERDAVHNEREDRERDARERKGLTPRLSEDQRQRLKWRRDLERFIAARTDEVIKAGMHPDALKRLGGAR